MFFGFSDRAAHVALMFLSRLVSSHREDVVELESGLKG
jgi:hypothetical protein